MMETEKSTSWGTGLEQQATGFVVFDLHPQWLAPTEQRVTRDVVVANTEVRYDMDSLLRGDSAARAAFYNVMRFTGAYNADDIRERENLPPIPDGKGKTYLQPVNMQPSGMPTPAKDGANGGT
jgi:phage portal protein BeeE